MAQQTNSTQGSKLSFAVQTDFNTPNTAGMTDYRPEGEPTPETGVGDGDAPDVVGANAMYNEKPIVTKRPSDSAIAIGTLIRQAATPGEDSCVVTAFRANGCEVAQNDDTTVAAGSTAGIIKPANTATATAANIQLDDGRYFPTLFGAFSGGTDLIPVMSLPSAPSTGNEIRRANCIYPGAMVQVPNSQLLTHRLQNKTNITQYQDCALASIGDLALNSEDKLMMEFTFGASDSTTIETPMVGSNSFQDGVAALRWHEPYCQFATASSDYSVALAASYQKVISATITFGLTAAQITGFGDANCKNNLQGWMQVGEPASLSIDMLYDSDKISDFDGDNESKYISFIQPGYSALDPATGFFMPVAHQYEKPEMVYYGNNEHRVTCKYMPVPSAMSGSTSADVGNQPWYFVVGDRSAA